MIIEGIEFHNWTTFYHNKKFYSFTDGYLYPIQDETENSYLIEDVWFDKKNTHLFKKVERDIDIHLRSNACKIVLECLELLHNCGEISEEKYQKKKAEVKADIEKHILEEKKEEEYYLKYKSYKRK